MLIVVLLLTVAVVYNVTTGKSLIDMFSATDKQVIEDKTGIINQDNKVENIEKNEKVKVEYKNIVETIFEKHETKSGSVPCEDNITATIDIMVPSINIDTDNVAELNKEIMKKAEDEIANLDKDMVYGDIRFLYEYTYIPTKDLLSILVTEGYGAFCATGGTTYNNYIYDIKNDKVLTNKEVLELCDVSEEYLKELAYENIDYYDEEEEAKERYKETVDELIKNKEYIIKHIGEDSILIYFDIHLERLTVQMSVY